MACPAAEPQPTTDQDRDDLGVAPLRGFRTDVQALRGLAVLGVVLYHAGVVLPGGFVGVDVFFVISGFVIGRLLLRQLLDADRISFSSFYARRARRLLPALALMLVIVTLLSPVLAPLGGRSIASASAVATGLFGANVYLYGATEGGYFADAADLNPLLHTWSLSVEEQFYFVMPVLLLLAWSAGRRRDLRSIRVGVLALVALSFAVCVYFAYSDVVLGLNGVRFAFFSPFTRAWEFATGLALVLIPARWLPCPRTGSLLAGAGLVAIGVAMLGLVDLVPFPGFVALWPVLGTAAVITGLTRAEAAAVVPPGSPLRAMVWLGDVSYSYYLWHWPFVVFAAGFWPRAGSTPRVIAAAVALLPAWLSYRFVEERFRKVRRPRAHVAFAIALACVFAPLIAAVIAAPLAATVTSQPRVAAFEEGRRLHIDERAGCSSPVPLGERPESSCSWGDADSSTSIVLIGDSNAGQFSEAFIGAAETTGAHLRIATMPACPFIDVVFSDAERRNFACPRFVRRSIEHMELQPPDLVVIANATDFYLSNERFSGVDRQGALTGASREEIFSAGLGNAIRRLRAAGTEVAVVNVIPKPGHWTPAECSPLAIVVAEERCSFSEFPAAGGVGLKEARRLETRVAETSNAELWNFDDAICPAGTCSAVEDGAIARRDEQHISVRLSESLAPLVRRFLQSLTD